MEEPDVEREDTGQSEEQTGQFPSFSPLQMGMFSANELYHGARHAGFNAGQAIYLVACAITGGPRPPMSAEGLE